MKILAVSDVVDPLVQSPAIAERFKDVELILSCGDLPFDYLEYIVTMLCKKLYFVHGNHVQSHVTMSDGSIKEAAEGCINIHRRVINHRGLLIAGLEGSMRYREGDHQYTQAQMQRTMWLLAPTLWLNRMRYGRAVDILITHAPPLGIHDGEDLCHQGFAAFLRFMDTYQPRYLVHGHTHLYRQDAPRMTVYGETTVLNAFGFQLIEIDETKLGQRRVAERPWNKTN